MLSTVYTMGEFSRALDLMKAARGDTNEDPRQAKRGRVDSTVSVNGRNASGSGWILGQASAATVLTALESHAFNTVEVTVKDVRVIGPSGGVVHAVRGINPHGVAGGKPTDIADMKARATDDARYINVLKNTISEHETTISELEKKDGDSKALITQLTDTIEVLLTEKEHDRDSIRVLVATLRLCQTEGMQSAVRYIMQHRDVLDMIEGGVPSGV